MKNTTVLFLTLFILLTARPCSAAIVVDEVSVESILNPKSSGTGYISDANHLLNQNTIDRVNSILEKLDTSRKAQVAVVLVNTIAESVPKDFATKLFRYWQLGYKGANNGLLILIVKDQRRIEFEVGYGLEGTIPDIISNRIQQQAMVPYLKKGDYNAAVLEGVMMIDKILGAEKRAIDAAPREDNVIQKIVSWLICFIYVFFTFMIVLDRKPKLAETSVPVIAMVILGPVILDILLVVFTPVKTSLLLVLLTLYFTWAIFYGFYFKNIQILDPREERYTSRQDYYALIKKAMNGLGTYTSIFPLPFLFFFFKKIQRKLKDLRYTPYQCEHCKQNMQMVTTNKEDYLSDGEKCAEKLGAISYDVWICGKDNNILKIDFINDDSKFRKCESCENITASKIDTQIEKPADYDHSGIARDHYLCEYCKARFDIRVIIPQLIVGTAIASSNDSDSDSDSSSSSSSDSWGGGSSGGGGSGSSW